MGALAVALVAALVAALGLSAPASAGAPASRTIDLSSGYGTAWTDPQPKQLLLAFDLSAGRVFRLDYGDDVQIVFGERHVSLIAGNPRRIQTHVRYLPETRYIAMAMSVGEGLPTSLQLVESDAARGYLRSSPIVSLPIFSLPIFSLPSAIPSQRLSMYVPDTPSNRTPPLLTDTILRPAGDAHLPAHRPRRHIACDAAPELIHVVNYFLGLCGRAAQPVLAPSAPAGDTLPPARLVRVVANGRNPMGLMAGAHACGFPLDYAVAPRMKRDTVPSLACLSRATLIVTLYQALFPRQWDLAHFTRMIDNVLGGGGIGEPVPDARDATAFVGAVLQQTGTADTRRADALNAFHRANAALGTFGAWSPSTSPSTSASTSPSTPAARCTAAPSANLAPDVARARAAAIGRYEIDLTGYTPRTIVPRIRRYGNWVESGAFTHTIVDTDDMAALREIIDTTGAWHARYAAHEQSLSWVRSADCAEARRQRLAYIATSIAFNINNDAHGGTSDGTVFVVVRHAGAIVSIQQAQRQRDAMHIVDSLSAPDNVIAPNAEGALRGAGAYALQQLFEYSRSHGLRRVTSDAITEPSALLKTQAGFHRTGDR